MKINLAILYLLFTIIPIFAQSGSHSEKLQIMKVLMDQEKAWNQGNIIDYMQGYWNSDSLRFIGSNGITMGWKETLEKYQSNYPNLSTMGKLKFEIISIEFLATDKYLVIGKWHLKRDLGDIGGYFTLLWKKFETGWKIVLDHTS